MVRNCDENFERENFENLGRWMDGWMGGWVDGWMDGWKPKPG